MGRYRTPAGVVIEMADKAATAVGYQAVEPAEAEKDEAPKRKPGRPKKK